MGSSFRMFLHLIFQTPLAFFFASYKYLFEVFFVLNLGCWSHKAFFFPFNLCIKTVD